MFSSSVRRLPEFVAVSCFDVAEEHRLWAIRESGLAATARIATEHPTWPGWEDSAVAPETFGAYLRDMRSSSSSTSIGGDRAVEQPTRSDHLAHLVGEHGQGNLLAVRLPLDQ